MNIPMTLSCSSSCEFGHDERGDGLHASLQKDNYATIDGEQVKARREARIEHTGICTLREEINPSSQRRKQRITSPSLSSEEFKPTVSSKRSYSSLDEAEQSLVSSPFSRVQKVANSTKALLDAEESPLVRKARVCVRTRSDSQTVSHYIVLQSFK